MSKGDDIIKQAKWELELERFEQEVAKEKARLRNKRSWLPSWFPWRIKLININNRGPQ